MNFDDDDDFDMNDELSDEENEELNQEMERRRRSVKNHPLFKQVNEASHTLKTLLESSNQSGEDLESFTESLTGAMMVVTAKLYAALGSDSYLVCMQNAAIIRNEAEYLRLSSHMLNFSKNYDKAYVSVFREEMEKFRILFIEWAKQIHTMDRDGLEDEWGLFL
jgi:hypothetical protein